MHPAHTTTDAKRDRRNIFMAQFNVAYTKGDLAAIKKLIIKFSQNFKAIGGNVAINGTMTA
jgi:hypothetical protein